MAYRPYPRYYPRMGNNGLQYQSQFVPTVDPNILGNFLQRQDTKFNLAQQYPNKLVDLLNQTPVFDPDRAILANKIDTQIKDINKTVEEDYGGDWGAALPDITSRITRSQGDVTRAAQLYQEYLPIQQMLMRAKAEGRGIYDPSDVANLGQRGLLNVDSATGNIVTRPIPQDFQFYDDPEILKSIQQNVSDPINRSGGSEGLSQNPQYQSFLQTGDYEGMADLEVRDYYADNPTLLEEQMEMTPQWDTKMKAKYGKDWKRDNMEEAKQDFMNTVISQTSKRIRRKYMNNPESDPNKNRPGRLTPYSPLGSYSYNTGTVTVNEIADKNTNINKVDPEDPKNVPLVEIRKRLESELDSELENDISQVVGENAEKYKKPLLSFMKEAGTGIQSDILDIETNLRTISSDNFETSLKEDTPIEKVNRTWFRGPGFSDKSIELLKKSGIKTVGEAREFVDYSKKLQTLLAKKQGYGDPYSIKESSTPKGVQATLNMGKAGRYNDLLQSKFEKYMEDHGDDLIDLNTSNVTSDEITKTNQFIEDNSDFLPKTFKEDFYNGLSKQEKLDLNQKVVWSPQGATLYLFKGSFNDKDNTKGAINIRQLPTPSARRLAAERQEPELYVDHLFGEALNKVPDIEKASYKNKQDVWDNAISGKEIVPGTSPNIKMVKSGKQFALLFNAEDGITKMSFPDSKSTVDALMMINGLRPVSLDVFQETYTINSTDANRLKQIASLLNITPEDLNLNDYQVIQ